MDIDHEISLLVACLKRIGVQQENGSVKTNFIQVFKDEILEQQLESLVGKRVLFITFVQIHVNN